jgi:hypothetical protein
MCQIRRRTEVQVSHGIRCGGGEVGRQVLEGLKALDSTFNLERKTWKRK